MSPFNFKKTLLFRAIAYTVLTAFIGLVPEKPSFAQVAIMMPPPGQMIHITNHFEPPQMVGLKINLKDPFSFDFIMDQGERPMDNDVMKQEFNKIIKYFLVSLAMPNKEMWVNLSPYESTRIIPEVFAQTEMGRDLLAQDYVLKQFTASLMYPESGLGKEFWSKVYAQAQERFGTTQISVNTFNKVWIVADHADVYQKDDTAFLVGSHLKVMLEQDYMAIEKNKEMFGALQPAMNDTTMDAKTKMASQVVREIIIPAIEKEVNEGKSFAAVRQVYNAEIMATWFKRTLRQSLLGQVFDNKSKVAGQLNNDPQAMEKIYKQYLRAYKKGVYNYIREDMTPDGQTIPRKYFSGGMEEVDRVQNITPRTMAEDPAQAAEVKDFAQKAENLTLMQRLQVAGVRLFMAVGAVGGLVAATNPALAQTAAPTSFWHSINPANLSVFHSSAKPAVRRSTLEQLQVGTGERVRTQLSTLSFSEPSAVGVVLHDDNAYTAVAGALNEKISELDAAITSGKLTGDQLTRARVDLQKAQGDLATLKTHTGHRISSLNSLLTKARRGLAAVETDRDLFKQSAEDRARAITTLTDKVNDLTRQINALQGVQAKIADLENNVIPGLQRQVTDLNATNGRQAGELRAANQTATQYTEDHRLLPKFIAKFHDYRNGVIGLSILLAAATLIGAIGWYKYLRNRAKTAQDAAKNAEAAASNATIVAEKDRKIAALEAKVANLGKDEQAAKVNPADVDTTIIRHDIDDAAAEGRVAEADMREVENLAAVNDARKIVLGEVPAEQVIPAVHEAAGKLVDAERAEADVDNEVIDAENAILESAFPQANGGVETALAEDEAYQTLKANEEKAETDQERQDAKQARRDYEVKRARDIVQRTGTPEADALHQRLTVADNREEETAAAKKEAVAAFNAARAEAPVQAENNAPSVAEQLAAVREELRIARGNLEDATNSAPREEVDRLVAREAELANTALAQDREALESAPIPVSEADKPAVDIIVSAENEVAVDEKALAGAITEAETAGVKVNLPEPAFSVREGLAQLNTIEQQLNSIPERIQAAKAQIEPARNAAKNRKQGAYESHDAWQAAVVDLEAALEKAHKNVAEVNAEAAELIQQRHDLAVKIVQNFDAQTQRVHQEVQAVNDSLQASATAKARLAAAHQSLNQYSTDGKVNVEAEQRIEQEIRDAERAVNSNNIDITEAHARLAVLSRQQRSNSRIRSGIIALRAAYTDKAASAVAGHHDDKVGGINLSDENLTLNVKVDGMGMPLPAQFQDRAMVNLSGLTSVIRTITPLTPQNVPALYDLLK